MTLFTVMEIVIMLNVIILKFAVPNLTQIWIFKYNALTFRKMTFLTVTECHYAKSH
jgi:hypothetical protein